MRICLAWVRIYDSTEDIKQVKVAQMEKQTESREGAAAVIVRGASALGMSGKRRAARKLGSTIPDIHKRVNGVSFFLLSM